MASLHTPIKPDNARVRATIATARACREFCCIGYCRDCGQFGAVHRIPRHAGGAGIVQRSECHDQAVCRARRGLPRICSACGFAGMVQTAQVLLPRPTIPEIRIYHCPMCDHTEVC